MKCEDKQAHVNKARSSQWKENSVVLHSEVLLSLDVAQHLAIYFHTLLHGRL